MHIKHHLFMEIGPPLHQSTRKSAKLSLFNPDQTLKLRSSTMP